MPQPVPELTDQAMWRQLDGLTRQRDQMPLDDPGRPALSGQIAELQALRAERQRAAMQEALTLGAVMLEQDLPVVPDEWIYGVGGYGGRLVRSPSGRTYIDPTPPGAFPVAPVAVFVDSEGGVTDLSGASLGKIRRAWTPRTISPRTTSGPPRAVEEVFGRQGYGGRLIRLPGGHTYVDVTPPGAFPVEPIPVWVHGDEVHGPAGPIGRLRRLPASAVPPVVPFWDGEGDDEDSELGDEDDFGEYGESSLDEDAREVRRRDRQRVLEGLAREQGRTYRPPADDLLDNSVFDRELRKLGVHLDHINWEMEQLARDRLHALQRLATEQGKIYGNPPDDLWDDEVYAREMAKLGYARSDDPAAGGWEETPPPASEPPSWDPDKGSIDRVADAMEYLVNSGQLKEEFIQALPSISELIELLVFLIAMQFVPIADIVLDIYLVYLLGSALFPLLDALSHLSSASNEQEYYAAVDELGEVLARIGVDTLIALILWGGQKGMRKIRGPRARAAPRRARGPSQPQPKPPIEPPAEGPRSGLKSGKQPRLRRPRLKRPFEEPLRPKRSLDEDLAEDTARERRGRGIREERVKDRGRHGREERVADLADDPNAEMPRAVRRDLKRQRTRDPTAQPKLPKGYELGHQEPTYDPKTGRVLDPGKTASDGYGYAEAEPITKKQNARENATRTRNRAKYARHLRNFFARIRRLLREGRKDELRKLLRKMIEEGTVLPENIPEPLQWLLE